MKHFAPPPVRVDPLDAFKLRAEARAYLWFAGEMSLHEAVDGLIEAADRDALIYRIGHDEVQRILADAFQPYREGANG
jgi:hypothetical protein